MPLEDGGESVRGFSPAWAATGRQDTPEGLPGGPEARIRCRGAMVHRVPAGLLIHPQLVRSPDGSVYLRDGTERKMR